MARWTAEAFGFVIAVIFTVLFIPLTVEFMILVPWMSPLTTRSGLLLMVYNFCVAMLIANYTLVMFRDPGKVDVAYVPEGLSHFGEVDAGSPEFVPVKAKNGAPRFCSHCNVFKPPRTHHCRVCKRCVLRMDHHCPWVNNCIGFNNQAHFVRFLFWTVASVWFTIVLLMWRVTDSFYGLVDGPPTEDGRGGVPMRDGEVIVMGINITLLIPTTALTTMLFGNQVWYLFYNLTTIEAIEKADIHFSYSGQVANIQDPYNVGIYRNICSVLGKRWYLWMLPGVPSEGDGYSFPIARSAKERLLSGAGSSDSSRSGTPLASLVGNLFGDARQRIAYSSDPSPILHRGSGGQEVELWDMAIDIDDKEQ